MTTHRKAPMAVRTLAGLYFIFAALIASTSSAATFERIPVNAMGCVLRMDGTIAAGDADRLAVMLESIVYEFSPTPVGERICLDSAGGSLVEAVRIGELISRSDYGTAIAAGATCESACGIVFMSGRFSHPEADGGFVPDRVLHPRGRLGFHAPALLIEDRDYSRDEVNRAYNVALASMGEIVRLRSERRNRLADSLLLTILSTPASGMTYVETVGQAARWRIDVAPVALPTGDVNEAVLNACDNADAGLLDTAPVSRRTFGLSHGPDITFTTEGASAGSAITSGGYRSEAAANCEIRLFQSDSMLDRLGYLTIEGGSSNEDTRVEVYPHLFHLPDTRLSDLPVPATKDESGFGAFIAAFATAGRDRLQSVGFESCFLQRNRVQIVNVQNFVNLRSAPGFDTAIQRELPLGERVSVQDLENVRAFGAADLIRRCRDICGQAARRSWDSTLRAQVNACVNDHALWYRVRDQRGNTGYVSRKFLSELE